MKTNSNLQELIKYISENIDKWNSLQYIPKDGWEMLGNHNIIGISRSGENGVSKFADTVSQLCVLKNAGFLSSYAINEISLNLLYRFEKDLDKTVYEEILKGHKNISMSMTEEKAGSDLAAIEAEGICEDGYYTLTGKKVLISNGPIADYFIVAVKTNKDVAAWRGITLFLLNKDEAGLILSSPVAKAGANLMPISEMQLNGIKVSEDKILGKKNRGFEYLMNALNFERTVISILSVSMSEDVLKEVMGYLESREIFGKKLRDYQNTKFVIAKLFSRTKVVRNFVDTIIAEFDRGIVNKTNISIAKILSTELLIDVITSISQLYGASGYLSSHWISNYYNDIRWTSIAGGANELLLDVLGNNLVHGGS